MQRGVWRGHVECRGHPKDQVGHQQQDIKGVKMLKSVEIVQRSSEEVCRYQGLKGLHLPLSYSPSAFSSTL